MKASIFQLPPPPSMSEQDFEESSRTKNFIPHLYEIYKYIGIVGANCAMLHPDSPDLRKLPKHHWAILIGLLNRCCRLMLSNIALSHRGLHAESMRIFERCITESAITTMWLCKQNKSELFDRFLANGTTNDIELRMIILDNIAKRGNKVFGIEKRMLESIDELTESTGMTIKEIQAMLGLPNLRQRMESLNLDYGVYLAFQKMGSHSVHGTWPDLFTYYLEQDESGMFHPSDHDARPHENQYLQISFIMLDTILTFLKYVLPDRYNVYDFAPQLKQTRDLIIKITNSLAEGDWIEAD